MAPLPLALLIGALAVALRLLASRRSSADREKLAETSLLERYVRLPAHAVPPIRLALLGAGVVAIALASGSGGTEARRLDEGGAETILVLDASNSMLAADVEPSRLEMQRQLAGRLATRTDGRMVVYIAGRRVRPFAADHGRERDRMLAEGVRPAAVGWAARRSSASGLHAGDRPPCRRRRRGRGKSICRPSPMLRDKPRRALRGGDRGARTRIVHPFGWGFGTEVGRAKSPEAGSSLDPTNAARVVGREFGLQPDGGPVVTRLNAASLRQMSLGTGGRYVDGADGIDAIERELGQGGREPLTSTEDAAVAALLLLAFVSLWGEGFLLPRG